MHTEIKTNAGQTCFFLLEVPKSYHSILRKWDYELGEEGFSKTFPTDTPGLEAIYQRFSQSIENIIMQALGLQPIPWQETLLRVLAKLDGKKINWFLGGSTALAVRGVNLHPHDVDLVSDVSGALRIGDILGDFLYEPMTRYHDWICDWSGHAYLGARVEWVGGVHPEIDAEAVSDFGPIAASRLETIRWRGYTLRTAPLEMQLAVSQRRGLLERAAAIQTVLDETTR